MQAGGRGIETAQLDHGGVGRELLPVQPHGRNASARARCYTSRAATDPAVGSYSATRPTISRRNSDSLSHGVPCTCVSDVNGSATAVAAPAGVGTWTLCCGAG